MKHRRMPRGLQIFMFKRLFMVANAHRRDPAAEMDNIDWEAHFDSGMNFHENLDNFKNAYAEYDWNIIEAVEHHPDFYSKRYPQYYKKWELLEESTNPLVILSQMKETDFEIEKDDFVPEDEPEYEEEGWRTEPTTEGEVHSIEVQIEPHTQQSKGKTYMYGRIQLLVPSKFIGLNAKVSVLVAKELL